jgi:aspartyl/asparaginyl-tRNA synthetase
MQVNNKQFNSCEYHIVTKKLRVFFESKGFIEVHTQSRLSILAACEDPETIATFDYDGIKWPLPQTGQMWLEYELLTNPDANGFFCLSTSYRNEPNPVEGRHEKIFPMFEFELKGNMEDMIALERELLEFLGFGNKETFASSNYDDVCKKYNATELDNDHEDILCKENGPIFFLTMFPNFTSPFWNMKLNDESTKHANKVDVIIHGMETIGSAQRSNDPDEMRKQFYSISDGKYAQILFDNFTKERVETELDEFLKFNFIERSGGGIGLTRLVRGMKLSGLL